MSKDYYEILGVGHDADAETIKKAYRKRAMKVHPDVAQTEDAAEQFKELNEAYEVLKDPQKRAMYDRGGDPMGPGGMGGGFGGMPGFGGAGGFDFTDLIGSMFGQATSRGPRSRVRKGQDALVGMSLTLAEAAFGVTKPLQVDTAVLCSRCAGSGSAEGNAPVTCRTCHGAGEVTQVQRSFLGDIRTSSPCPACRGYGTVIPDPCPECSGEGRVRTTRTLNVKVPAGVDSGNRIHLAAQGEVGPGGGPAGDLYVELRVEAHENFTRKGSDLETVVRVPMTAAALGTSVKVPTLDAEKEGATEEEALVDVEIPAGTQSGTRITVRGRGVPKLRSNSRGDMGVTFLVQTPTKLDPEQRDLLRQLADLRGEHEVRVGHAKEKGFFGKLRDAFEG
ncbi:molecular chaperone DnaJ [Raineyella fluvialis]|uniref:Chaperone protein DnaJ n=1 Tax=Raineyella fluvialis TaxID=2662261 RepID=A0A5Q2FI35_9ACTN|nr:molecular chaperone DnaJ [Raineyella fluvialis]QGF24325.1 molecular chaperone DnaJ [Raineyella fluvialis]